MAVQRVLFKLGGQVREVDLDTSRDYQPSGRDRYARWRT
jgi:hypothetical protein